MRYFILLYLWSSVCFGQQKSVADIGQKLIYENKYDEAVVYYNNQLSNVNTNSQKFHFLLGLAEVYKLKLNYNKANSYYIKAFGVVKKTGDYQLEFLYYVKMAEFYRKRALHKQAIVQLDKADALLKKHRITDAYLAKYYSRKAAVSTEFLNIADSTLLYAQKSLLYATKINDQDNIFYSRLEIEPKTVV